MSIESLRIAIEPYRQQAINHPVFNHLKTLDAIKIFTQSHVFAVWDFMALLKTLQRQLTCVTSVWLPTQDVHSRRFINEIVLAEESDIDLDGNPISHFELYLHAMHTLGACTEPIGAFISDLKAGQSVPHALQKEGIPSESRAFVASTWALVDKHSVWDQAGVFAFGREDLIPDMFKQIIDQLATQFPQQLAPFQYYLDRHIELDQTDHGPLSLKMIEMVCEQDPSRWQSVQVASIHALKNRIALWDGVLATLCK